MLIFSMALFLSLSSCSRDDLIGSHLSAQCACVASQEAFWVGCCVVGKINDVLKGLLGDSFLTFVLWYYWFLICRVS